MELIEELRKVQVALKAPKTNMVAFGSTKYKYRSCEQMLELIKPLLKEGYSITLKDDLIETRENGVYIKATATFTNGKDSIETRAFAKEDLIHNKMSPEQKTGAFTKEKLVYSKMSPGQKTGTASSYARKYALSGLVLADDNRDLDSIPQQQETKMPEEIKWLKEMCPEFVEPLAKANFTKARVIKLIKDCKYNKKLLESAVAGLNIYRRNV